MRAKDVMTTPVITVAPETGVKEAAALLVRHEISAMPVVGPEGLLVGIVSEADLVRMEMEPDPRSHILPVPHRTEPLPKTVGEVMTRDVVTADPGDDVAHLARMMLEKRIKRVPVVEEGCVVGIVSRRDLLRVLARNDAEIKAELDELLTEEISMIGRYEPEVSEGVVTLRGANGKAERHLAELLARSVPGVVAVRFAD